MNILPFIERGTFQLKYRYIYIQIIQNYIYTSFMGHGKMYKI